MENTTTEAEVVSTDRAMRLALKSIAIELTTVNDGDVESVKATSKLVHKMAKLSRDIVQAHDTFVAQGWANGKFTPDQVSCVRARKGTASKPSLLDSFED